ncbi:PREDICTED: ER membrane protein complex subunit 10 [Bactrocera latifrons]|uniref:ER membrane protein complex subunit 10 n=1 Tax=Bactrocera latifrons TaxID=174628 RepID=UPI0008DC7B7A|nr:PREDICTED: ER membrane protein complex subunit 10 [Bactrocera latifrons]
MEIFKHLYFVLVFFFNYKFCLGYLEYDNWVNIELSHAIDPKSPNSFTYRGNVTISNLDIGLAKSNQEALTGTQIQNLQSLARMDKLYRLKAEVSYADGKKQEFLSSTKACNLIMSNLNDILWISIDLNGYINAATVLTSSSDICFYENISVSGLEDFNTDVLIRHTETAPVPDTTSFIQKLEREREARERGDVRDNRGFFSKYWMYIVPVVLLVFISGATNQDNSK